MRIELRWETGGSSGGELVHEMSAAVVLSVTSDTCPQTMNRNGRPIHWSKKNAEVGRESYLMGSSFM